VNAVLPRAFYARDTHRVARDLLGKCLVRRFDGQRLTGSIVEVEAYCGENDQACHASCGPTRRNAPMYGPPGHTYVYLIYGMYCCLNVVTEQEGIPAAVLIRALEPIEGIAAMQQQRGTSTNLTNGPGRLCQALRINRACNALDVCAPDAPVWIEDAPPIVAAEIAQSPRIGVRGDEVARTCLWRYYLRHNRWVSGPKTIKLLR